MLCTLYFILMIFKKKETCYLFFHSSAHCLFLLDFAFVFVYVSIVLPLCIPRAWPPCVSPAPADSSTATALRHHLASGPGEGCVQLWDVGGICDTNYRDSP